MRKLMQLMALARANGWDLTALFAYLVAHKTEIVAIVNMLIALLSGGTFAADEPEPTKAECVADCVANGASAEQADAICDELATAA